MQLYKKKVIQKDSPAQLLTQMCLKCSRNSEETSAFVAGREKGAPGKAATDLKEDCKVSGFYSDTGTSHLFRLFLIEKIRHPMLTCASFLIIVLKLNIYSVNHIVDTKLEFKHCKILLTVSEN